MARYSVSPPLSNQGDQQIIIKIVGRCNNQTTRHSQRCPHQDEDVVWTVDTVTRTGTVRSIFTPPPTWHCVTCHADSWAVSRGQFVMSSSDSVFGKLVLQCSDCQKTYAKKFLCPYFLCRNKQGNEDC